MHQTPAAMLLHGCEHILCSDDRAATIAIRVAAHGGAGMNHYFRARNRGIHGPRFAKIADKIFDIGCERTPRRSPRQNTHSPPGAYQLSDDGSTELSRATGYQHVAGRRTRMHLIPTDVSALGLAGHEFSPFCDGGA